MTFLVSAAEVAEMVGKELGATKVWMHRHCVKAVQRVNVGERSTRALYDGDLVKRHAAAEVPVCPACVGQRRRVTSIATGTNAPRRRRG